MTFRDFARNYLNPAYLLLRLGWLGVAFFFIIVTPHMEDLYKWRIVFYILGAIFIWNGIRPWGRGRSINDINRKLDELNNR
ncbi:MAG: hypothetical protein NTZ64_18555 [Polaromonas sp.]|nr:hypothetical protein [Polaromonas sp.]